MVEQRIAFLQQEYRLSFNALSRSIPIGCWRSPPELETLAEALEVMSRVRLRQEVESGTFRSGETYKAACVCVSRTRRNCRSLSMSLTAVGYTGMMYGIWVPIGRAGT